MTTDLHSVPRVPSHQRWLSSLPYLAWWPSRSHSSFSEPRARTFFISSCRVLRTRLLSNAHIAGSGEHLGVDRMENLVDDLRSVIHRHWRMDEEHSSSEPSSSVADLTTEVLDGGGARCRPTAGVEDVVTGDTGVEGRGDSSSSVGSLRWLSLLEEVEGCHTEDGVLLATLQWLVGDLHSILLVFGSMYCATSEGRFSADCDGILLALSPHGPSSCVSRLRILTDRLPLLPRGERYFFRAQKKDVEYRSKHGRAACSWVSNTQQPQMQCYQGQTLLSASATSVLPGSS
jgi:hypothetical protein